MHHRVQRREPGVTSSPVTPALRTQRLHLDPYIPGDEEEFVALCQDPEVARWRNDTDGPTQRAGERARFRRILTHVYPLELGDAWAVRLDGRLVGHAAIALSETLGGHELTCALAPSVRSGAGAELVDTLLAYSVYALSLPHLHTRVDAADTVFLKLLQNAAFTPVRDIEEPDGRTIRLLTRHLTLTGRPADEDG